MDRIEYIARDFAEKLVEHGYRHTGVDTGKMSVDKEGAKQMQIDGITESLMEEIVGVASSSLIRSGVLRMPGRQRSV